MKYLQTFKENFDFERQPIINMQDFLPDYHETKYWKLTRNILKEDIDKGIVKQNQTNITMYWKVEKISDKNYIFISQSVNNNNKISK